MSLSHSSSIITNGLVFAYDSASRRSYKGPTITNLINGISLAGTGTGTGYSSTGVTEVVDIPQIGPTTVYTNYIQNNYPTSNNCCPDLFRYGGWDVSGSTLYTYAIVYRVDSGYTGANFMYRYEYNGGTYVTELGVHDTAKRIYLGDGWWWAWNTTTTQPSTTRINSSGLWYYQYSTVADRISVAKVLFAQGDYSGLHPKHWPESNTTRSNTQALVDLTGNNTITANNLTYASDGTFSFNGSSSWIESPTSSVFDSQTITMESWNKPTTTSQSGFLFEKGQVNTQYSNFYNSDGTFYFRTMGLSPQDLTFTASTYITAGQWNHIVCTVGGGVKTVYINGIQRYQQTGVTGLMPTGQANQYIGKYGGGGNNYPFNGSIAVSRVYNRTLSAAEVLQNFNALRGRFGI